MIELRPCPFCGGRAELNEHTGYGWRTVQCVECCASTSEAGVYTAAEAAARWNRRAATRAMKCARCGKVIRSKEDRRNFERYKPYHSYDCQQWANLEAAQRWLDDRRAAQEGEK